MSDNEQCVENQIGENECPICLDPLTTSWAQMCSSHRICGHCLVSYLEQKQNVVCPCCRAPTDFSGQSLPNDQKILYYTQQKRNRYLRCGDRVIQVEFQGERMPEARAKRLIGAAVNLILHMLHLQSREDAQQTLTFATSGTDVTMSLVGDILSINF